jgi:RimJ/RimL family protein N-acetyltransferase
VDLKKLIRKERKQNNESMRSGRVIRSFSVRGGQVVLRTPMWEDLDDLLELINSLVDEKADIIRAEKVSRDEEIDWFSGVLRRLEKEEVIYILGEVNGKVIASSEIAKRGGYEEHVGALGIVIKKGFRDLGIGTEIMHALVEQGQAWKLKVLTLSLFASNKRAFHVYEKVGFIETGRIPKKFLRNGEYIDEIIMTKLLE